MPVPPTAANAPTSENGGPSTWQSISTSRRVVFGIVALAVPMSLTRALGLVRFPGGRGLLLISDIDTIFLDMTIFAGLVLVATQFRRVKRNWSFALTALLVGGVTAVLLGYVVTNYGTLFRLRLIAAMPFWLLSLAVIDDDLVEAALRPDAARDAALSFPSIR